MDEHSVSNDSDRGEKRKQNKVYKIDFITSYAIFQLSKYTFKYDERIPKITKISAVYLFLATVWFMQMPHFSALEYFALSSGLSIISTTDEVGIKA